MKNGLLIIDDDVTILTQMKWAFNKEYNVFTAENRVEALSILKSETIMVVTLDLGLPPTPWDTQEGFLALSEITALNPNIKVIVITGNTQKEFALKSIDLGAFDFYLKPIHIDEIRFTVKRAFNISSIEKENIKLQKQLEHSGETTLIGSSEKMTAMSRIVEQVAPTNTSVLITGESGTGKEVVARSIWQKSNRNNEIFIPINCGAIPENLLESELFGYEKGAFTGANKTKKGLVELADGGTLLLDEIGDMPLSLQVKLLRFLQEQKIKRVGGQKEIAVDVRVLAATNKNLDLLIKKGQFRDDLFFRLAVLTIKIPALKERQGDIMMLAKYFLEKSARENKKVIKGFSKSAQEAVEGFDWPGNVRELENKVKRGVVLAESGGEILPIDMDMPVSKASTELNGNYANLSLKKAKEKFEKELLEKVLKKHDGNVSSAAKALETTRQNLHLLIAKYDLVV